MECPATEVLIQYRESGELPAELRSHVEHECRACTESVARVDRLLRALGDARFEEPSQQLMRRAAAIGGSQGGLVSGLREWVGSLVGGDQRGLVPAFRGPDAASDHLLYVVDRFEVDLCLLPNGSLVGQVLPLDEDADPPQDGDVYLYSPDGVHHGSLAEDGELRIADVAPGRYTLILETGDARLVLPEVTLGATDA
jgi:hypothetical protein